MAKYIVHARYWGQAWKGDKEANALTMAKALSGNGEDAVVFKDGKPWCFVHAGDNEQVLCELSDRRWLSHGIDPTVMVTDTSTEGGT